MENTPHTYPYIYAHTDRPINEDNIEDWMKKHTEWKKFQQDIMVRNSMPFVIKQGDKRGPEELRAAK